MLGQGRADLGAGHRLARPAPRRDQAPTRPSRGEVGAAHGLRDQPEHHPTDPQRPQAPDAGLRVSRHAQAVPGRAPAAPRGAHHRRPVGGPRQRADRPPAGGTEAQSTAGETLGQRQGGLQPRSAGRVPPKRRGPVGPQPRGAGRARPQARSGRTRPARRPPPIARRDQVHRRHRPQAGGRGAVPLGRRHGRQARRRGRQPPGTPRAAPLSRGDLQARRAVRGTSEPAALGRANLGGTGGTASPGPRGALAADGPHPRRDPSGRRARATHERAARGARRDRPRARRAKARRPARTCGASRSKQAFPSRR